MGGILHRPHGHRVKAVALRLAFQEAPYHRKLMPIVKDMEQLLALEFDRIVGLMVARVTLLRFDEEFDDIVSSGLATAKFDTLFESAVSSGYSGIKIATPTVDDVMAEQKRWGSALVKGVLGESAAQLNDIISEGIKAGKAREQIVNDLYQTRADDGILPEWRARLIAQTEVIRSYNAGSLAEKADTGVEYVRWLDGQRGACESCSHLEGVTIPMEPGKLKSQQNYFVDQLRGFVVQHPPLHPGCRCTIVGATAEEYLGQPNFDSLTYSTVPPIGSSGVGGIGAGRTIAERPLPRALPTIPTIPTTPSAKPVEKAPEPVSLPVTSPAVDAFRDWYAEHGAGLTGIEAIRAYAKYTGKPMKVLSDAIKTEGYEIKTLIATPRTDVLPGATAVKITPPGTFKKKVEPSAGKKAEEGLGKPEPYDPTRPALGKGPSSSYWDDLVQYKAQAGSNPGGFYRDPKTGAEYYLKKYADPAQAAAEIDALRLYKQLGIEVPAAQIIYRTDGTYYASRIVDGLRPATREMLEDYFKRHPEELARLHVGSVITQNWDVFGAGYDNVGFNSAGKLVVIDAGGSFTFRARGSAKTYDTTATEFKTLRDPSINPTSGAMFKNLYKTEAEIDYALAAARNLKSFNLASPSSTIKVADISVQWKIDDLISELEAAKAALKFTPKPIKPGEINVQPNYVDRLKAPTPSVMERIENTLRETMADAKLSMRIPSGVISKILDDGRFKSQFETNTSHGSLAPDMRAKAETNMFGYPKNLPPAERPVYGYLSPSGDDHNGPKHYGDIKAVFKDELKSRATFTYADSLGPGIGKQEVAPSLVSDPKWYSAGQYNWHESNLKNIRPYPEVQYHGGVSIDDIDYVLLPQPMPTVETQLKQKGITYYIDPELKTR